MDVDNVQKTLTVVLELLLVLLVLQGQNPVQERLVALLVQLDSTGQVLGLVALPVLPTPSLVLELLLVRLVLQGLSLVPDRLVAPLVQPDNLGQVPGLGAGSVPQTIILVQKLLLALLVLQGPSPVLEQHAAAYVPLAQPGSTGQVLGQDVVLVLPTPTLVQELLFVRLVLQKKSHQLDPIHRPLVTMVIQKMSKCT